MTVSTVVSDLIARPPIGLLNRSLIGDFTGEGDLTRPGPPVPPFNHVNAFGLTWSATTIPDGLGRFLGSPVIFEQRLVQLSTVHEDFGGHELVSEYHDFFVEGIYWLWENPGPSRIHYVITPGVELTFFWLLVG